MESLSRAGHKWESYNVDQLVSGFIFFHCIFSVCFFSSAYLFPLPPLSQKYVQMSALDDKDVRTAEQWHSAVEFMKSALKKQVQQTGLAVECSLSLGQASRRRTVRIERPHIVFRQVAEVEEPDTTAGEHLI